ncbi:MAG TPA: hypothetical protein VL326_14805 [Kofleriaceae bacterium]|nr:hypothetical protein [Kofleriaceae bacterium]
MAAEDNSGAKPAGPVVLRIKLRYENIDAMVQRFAPNVGKSGLFLPTKSIQPIGTEVKFELRLANDTPALVGIGKVKHVKPPDPANPKAAFGMAIELMRVSREGREVIIRMIERRRAMGLPDVAIPLPEDTETARRAEVETQPRAETSGIVRDAMQQFASAPVSEAVVTAPPSGPIAVAKEPSRPTPTAVPLMTSARDSGPISREASKSVPVLAPEAARAKRPRISDLIAKASELSGPLASVQVPGLDEHVDVDAVLARARVLAAGTDLETELANLRESSAAPVEISIDAASAELAKQLGGVAITKRDKSARWAPPPAIETKPSPPPQPEDFAHKTRAETEASAASVIAAVIDKAVEAAPPPDPARASIVEPAHEEPPPPEPVEEPVVAAPEPQMLIDDNADPSSFERAFSEAERLNTGDLERIDDDDFDGEDRGESTQIGAMPVDPNAFGAHGYSTMPDGGQGEELAEKLDRHLDEAEAEANADVSQGFQAEYPYAQEPPQEQAGDDEEVSDIDVLAEADEGDADLLTSDGEGDASREAPAYQDPVPAAYEEPVPEAIDARPMHVADSLANVELPDDISPDQLPPPDEFDAEAAAEFDRESAREFDRELRRESQGGMEAQEEPQDYGQQPQDYGQQAQDYQDRPSVSDFAARLDLGDDDPPDEPIAPPPVAYPRARRPSTDYPDPPSSSYTFAEQFPEAAIHPASSTLDRALDSAGEGEEFDEPHSYSSSPQHHQAAPRQAPPQPMHYEPPTAQPQAFEEPPKRPTAEDLEDALQALDVDLGDVNDRAVRRPGPTGQRPLPGLPIHRSTGPVPVTPKAPTGPVPVAPKVATGPVRTVAHTVKRAQTKPPTTPPPPPAAAFRKTPTQQVPVTPPQPSKRAPTDDGIVIDFDEDE